MAANRGFVDALAGGDRGAGGGLRGVAARPGSSAWRSSPQARGRPLVAGSPTAVAAAGAPLVDGRGRRLGHPQHVGHPQLAPTRVGLRRLTGLQVGVSRAGRPLVDTGGGARMVPMGGGDFEFRGRGCRGRAARLREVIGPPVVVSVYDPTDQLTGSLGNSRILIGGILLSFLLLALASSVFVVRALQDQIGSLLDAARRLAKGDFNHPVPTHGGDEFALLGREFNSMSQQLEAKIDELDSKRRELEETIRRVGAAFASGLDPQGILDLTLDTAIDACEATAGRAVPLRA